MSGSCGGGKACENPNSIDLASYLKDGRAFQGCKTSGEGSRQTTVDSKSCVAIAGVALCSRAFSDDRQREKRPLHLVS